MISKLKIVKAILLCAVSVNILLSIGCASISYTPSLALDTSPSTVNVRVKVGKFTDSSPKEDHETRFLGFSATNEKAISGDLATNVTNAVFNDFRNNYVFAAIEKRMDAPDLIMSGNIRRFHATSGLILATVPIDILWFIGLPCCTDEGIVDIEVQFRKPDGKQVASYAGSSQFDSVYWIYQNNQFALPSRLNKAFQDAVSQIRSKIIENQKYLESKKVSTASN